MELVAEYIDLNTLSIIDTPLMNIQPDWDTFHRSYERKISVFAGRGTGKSYNIALRAVRSECDCFVFVHNEGLVRLMTEKIADLSNPNDLATCRSDRSRSTITYRDGHSIDVVSLASLNLFPFRGTDFYEKEIMFDEAEYNGFSDFIIEHRRELERARRIVMVSSITRDLDTAAKRWFKFSDRKFYIDSDMFIPVEMQRYELYPSEMRHMIEQLPPIDYII
ncbi:hypothetical protein C2I27_03915 [Priestia megaterium]|uniref:hypothetical protein n=1 Tax=Priestia megaterium TaxID=1404 RepID=UPI000D508F3B|nr:hypothetical protein [Priestia megaterium]PVC75043.1 hypothetical protein C2I27_03915 [Priestia megaterium]